MHNETPIGIYIYFENKVMNTFVWWLYLEFRNNFGNIHF